MLKAEGKKAATRSGNYQDNVTAPLARDCDNDAIVDEDLDEDTRPMDDNDDSIPTAVERVSTLSYSFVNWTKHDYNSFGRSSRLSVLPLNVVRPGYASSNLCGSSTKGLKGAKLQITATLHSCSFST